MKFNDYLLKTIDIANEEKEILSPIELRAAKNSLQVIISRIETYSF